ncbi:MAG: hypothetical protein IIY06_00865 [Proteobacteria bacterium]|nr:hypothetical protein [Pseudomonadota bacterium]
MMSDDDKRMDSEKTSEEKIADVIDFEEAREKKEAENTDSNANSEPISLGEAIEGIKEMFASLRAQMEPVRHTINDLIDASKAGVASAREKMGLDEEGEPKDAANDEADTVKDEAASSLSSNDEDKEAKDIIDGGFERAKAAMTAEQETVKETSEVINLAYERLKRQGIEKKIDLQNVIREQFEAYADKNLTDKDYTIDENGKKVVKLDAKFMQEHGMEAIPTVLGGIAHSVVGTLFGDVLGIQPDKPKDEEVASDEAGTDASDASSATKDEPKYKVQFDFAKLLGEAIKGAKISSVKSSETGETIDYDNKDAAVAREVASKGAQLMEDVLNGKEPDESLSKIEGVIKEAQAPASLTPEEITPVDEKHQRILDLAKEYDHALKGEDENDET